MATHRKAHAVPLSDVRISQEGQRYPCGELVPSTVVAPCHSCRTLWAAGRHPLPHHPCCAARLAATGTKEEP
jgi:hypothetical protein